MAVHQLFAAEELSVGEKRVVKVVGKKILVCHLDDGFFAIQNSCTHMYAPLSKGKILDECQIQCPFHRAEFNLRTGEVVRWAHFPPGIQLLDAVRKEQPLQTYPVNIADGQVCIDVG